MALAPTLRATQRSTVKSIYNEVRVVISGTSRIAGSLISDGNAGLVVRVDFHAETSCDVHRACG
jgi:hypothetical protein